MTPSSFLLNIFLLIRHAFKILSLWCSLRSQQLDGGDKVVRLGEALEPGLLQLRKHGSHWSCVPVFWGRLQWSAGTGCCVGGRHPCRLTGAATTLIWAILLCPQQREFYAMNCWRPSPRGTDLNIRIFKRWCKWQVYLNVNFCSNVIQFFKSLIIEANIHCLYIVQLEDNLNCVNFLPYCCV